MTNKWDNMDVLIVSTIESIKTNVTTSLLYFQG